jgi:hypothetical protein
MIKGSATDPNAGLPARRPAGVLQAAIDSGAITIVGEAYTDGWLPANAQRNMEQILTANDNKVDAVVASNDGTAGGVVAALAAQGMAGIPVSGQDGDLAALNRVARARRPCRSGRTRATSAVRRARSPWRWPAAPRWKGRGDERHPPRPDADHEGQPQRRDRSGPHLEGAGLRRRGGWRGRLRVIA